MNKSKEKKYVTTIIDSKGDIVLKGLPIGMTPEQLDNYIDSMNLIVAGGAARINFVTEEYGIVFIGSHNVGTNIIAIREHLN